MRHGIDPSRLTPWAFAGLFAVLFALAAVPVVRCGILPLVDYPNHLARMALLARLAQDPTLQRFYALAWRPIPDLAMDVVVPPLLRFMPLLAAGKLFVLAIFFLLAGGSALIHRVAFGRWSAWPCLAFLFLYNRILLWGMLNYLFGLGLALCAFAAALALRERGILARIGVGAVLALAVWGAHFAAFGVYAVLWLGHEAAALLRARGGRGAGAVRLGVAALPLLLPIAIMLWTGAGAGGGVQFGAPWRKLDLLFSVFDLYHRPFDIACFVLAVAALGYAYWRRWLVLAPGLALPVGLLALAYLVLPSDIMGATGVDRRLPLALALALCGASAWVGGRARRERIFLAAAGAMLLVRLGTVGVSWTASDHEYRTLLAGLDAIPAGSRVAVAYPPAALNVQPTPLAHFPVLAAATRDAFVPTLFARPTQQPIVLQRPFRALAAATSPDRLWAVFVAGAAPLDASVRATLAGYDYIAFAGVHPFALADTAGLAPVFLAPRLRIYRLVRAVARIEG
jgi:hypothetical protein